MIKITEMIVPISSKHRPGTKRTGFRGITIHETANTKKGADAISHAKHYMRLATENSGDCIGYHLFVDDKQAILMHPLDEIAWTCGDKNGDGNMKTISIEICVNPECDFRKARANAAYVAAYVLNKYGHTNVIDGVSNGEARKKNANLFQHWSWTRKDCPHFIRAEGAWNSFVKDVEKELAVICSNEEKTLEQAENKFQPYLISVDSPDGFLNIRKTPSWDDSDIVKTLKNSNIKYTIVDEKMLDRSKFGKLKSGAGWICVDDLYVKKYKK